MKNMIHLAALGIALALSGCNLEDQANEGTETSKKMAGTNRTVPRVVLTPNAPPQDKGE